MDLAFEHIQGHGPLTEHHIVELADIKIFANSFSA